LLLLLMVLLLLLHQAAPLLPSMPYSSVWLLELLLLLDMVGSRAIEVIFCHKHIWHVPCSCPTVLLLHRLVPVILLLLLLLLLSVHP
jgi:hypothetical protein